MLAELGRGCAGISGSMSVLAGLYKRVLSLYESCHHQGSAEGLCASLYRKPPEVALDEMGGLVV